METKKLIKILLNDLRELEELIATVKANRQFKALEMEFIHTRTKGILQLVQLIDLNDEFFQPEVAGKSSKDVILPEVSVFEETGGQSEQDFDVSPEKEKEPKEQGEISREEEKPVALGSFSISVSQEKEESEAALAPVDEAGGKDDEDMLEEEAENIEKIHRLGETFAKGKSLNELTPEKNKL